MLITIFSVELCFFVARLSSVILSQTRNFSRPYFLSHDGYHLQYGLTIGHAPPPSVRTVQEIDDRKYHVNIHCRPLSAICYNLTDIKLLLRHSFLYSFVVIRTECPRPDTRTMPTTHVQ